jgi:hypothetical protein
MGLLAVLLEGPNPADVATRAIQILLNPDSLMPSICHKPNDKIKINNAAFGLNAY